MLSQFWIIGANISYSALLDILWCRGSCRYDSPPGATFTSLAAVQGIEPALSIWLVDASRGNQSDQFGRPDWTVVCCNLVWQTETWREFYSGLIERSLAPLLGARPLMAHPIILGSWLIVSGMALSDILQGTFILSIYAKVSSGRHSYGQGDIYGTCDKYTNTSYEGVRYALKVHQIIILSNICG